MSEDSVPLKSLPISIPDESTYDNAAHGKNHVDNEDEQARLLGDDENGDDSDSQDFYEDSSERPTPNYTCPSMLWVKELTVLWRNSLTNISFYQREIARFVTSLLVSLLVLVS